MSETGMSNNDTPGYRGDLLPREAWTMLEEEERAVLVDVRTDAEWQFVGQADLSSLGRPHIGLSWQRWPEMKLNASFVDDLSALLQRNDYGPDTPLLFLCRSGGRSAAAAEAMTRAGYTRCYNIAEGFEGPLDSHRHRGTSGGWKAAGLPWVQS